MPNTSIFAEEWRDCLRAHYTYVVRMDDKITERTLHGVMIEAGFTEAEVSELVVRATMRADDMDEDFVPDMDILQANASAEPAASFSVAVALPQADLAAALVEDAAAFDEVTAAAAEIDEAALDEAELDEAELDDSEIESEDDEPPADPDITQLSLF